MREHWREFGFWRWWWYERVPFEVKLLVGLAAAVLVFGGGSYLAWQLPGATASEVAYVPPEVRTVKRVVTVHERRGALRRVVPVVERVVVQGKTVTQTRLQATTVTQGGTTQVVTTEVVRRLPVLEEKVVTVGGKTRTQTVVTTVPGAVTTVIGGRVRTVVRPVPGRARTVTGERVTTVVTTTPGAARTVTDERVATDVRTVTAQLPAATVLRTVTEQSETQVRTVTVALPAVTSTRTVTTVQPTTVVQTTTETVTAPPTTVTNTVTTTVTVIVPPKGGPND